MKTKEEVLTIITSLIQLMPSYFYSPCGRKKLTQDEINLRRNVIESELKISDKEIIVRTFFDISKLSKSNWSQQFGHALLFLQENKIEDKKLYDLMSELYEEMKMLIRSKNRIIHNPF